MKLYTCALMPFVTNPAFFTRDSGLLCRTFQKLGIESRVIMPSFPENEKEDTQEIIRATDSEFIDPLWWKGLNIDGVVFITWGFKKHTPVLSAARVAGIKTCAIFETAGNSYPYFDFFSTIKTFWRKSNQVESLIKRFIGTFARALIFGCKGVPSTYHRVAQIGIPHYAAFDTPSSMERCQRVVSLFKSIPQNSKHILLGYPIPDFFAPLPKENRRTNIVAIARWDAIRHKRPFVLLKTIENTLMMRRDVTFEIFGFIPQFISKWHASLDSVLRERVVLAGVQPSARISESLGNSKVLYCPSASDGIPLCVAEALCGGCSVVGLKTRDVAGLFWAVNEGDGTFAKNDSINSHSKAILDELNAWDSNARDPMTIANRWKKWFSAEKVAHRTIALIKSDINS